MSKWKMCSKDVPNGSLFQMFVFFFNGSDKEIGNIKMISMAAAMFDWCIVALAYSLNVANSKG